MAPERRGWLQKRSGWLFPTWISRFIVIKDLKLLVSKSETSVAYITIDLDRSITIQSPQNCSFQLLSKNTTLSIRTETSEDKDAWLKTLHESIQLSIYWDDLRDAQNGELIQTFMGLREVPLPPQECCITRLLLDFNSIENIPSIQNFVKHYAHLKDLCMASNRLGNGEKIQYFPSTLENLDLSANCLGTKQCNGILDFLSPLLNLQSLSLSSNALSESDFIDISHLTSLQHIRLIGTLR